MKRKWLPVLLAIFLLAVLLSTTASAAVEDHESHKNGWIMLTEETLKDLKNGALSSGQYYFEEKAFLLCNTQLVIESGKTVTLCLNNASYTYTGEADAAIVVEAGGTLTICCCKTGLPGYDDPAYTDYVNHMYDGSISFDSTTVNGYCIKNYGTLTVTGGNMDSQRRYPENPASEEDTDGVPAAIYNAGTLNVQDGSFTAIHYVYVDNSVSTNNSIYGTAYGIYNAPEGTMTISGAPTITGTAPGTSLRPEGPQIDIFTSRTIQTADLYVGQSLRLIYMIGYAGEPNTAAISGLTEGTASYFWPTYPENGIFTWDENEEVIMFGGASSLSYCDQPVQDGVYYKVENGDNYYDLWGSPLYFQASGLVEGTKSDFNIYWDEASKTLTFHNLETEVNWDAFQTSGSVFCSDCETMTVKLEGVNTISALNSVYYNSVIGHVMQNKSGDIVFESNEDAASLTIEIGQDNNSYKWEQVSGIKAAGCVENAAKVSVTGENVDVIGTDGELSGISCDSFTNSGAVNLEFEECNSVVGISVEGDTFINRPGALVDIDMNCGSGIGVYLGAAGRFENGGELEIDMTANDVARGVAGKFDGDGAWENTGTVTISVTGDGDSVGGFANLPLAGVDLRGRGNTVFTNAGSLTVKARATKQSETEAPVWPAAQYFDTMGVYLSSTSCTVKNAGIMALTAVKGYSAGLVLDVQDEGAITSSGDLTITATTLGGEGIRAVGIYAQRLTEAAEEIGDLPLTLEGGNAVIRAQAEGENVAPGNLMALCLTQLFDGVDAPDYSDSLQQIYVGQGYMLSEMPLVYSVGGPEGYINTVGDTVDGQPVSAAELRLLKVLTGSVEITGSKVSGSTLTAKVTGLPEDLKGITYQWQAADSKDGPFTSLEGETGVTLALTSRHVGKYIRVVVAPSAEDVLAYGGTLVATTTSPVTLPTTRYPIYVEETDHGTVKAPTRAEAGETVTFTVTPDEGYVLGSLTITDYHGNEVDYKSLGGGKYSFEMPTASVTIQAVFVPEKLPFVDVQPGDWYYEAVAYVYENSLMDGVGATRFDPNGAVTRAMVWTVLARIDGKTITGGDWVEESRAWAMDKGVSDGTNPMNPVTREQLATMLYRYLGSPAVTGSLTAYPDAAQVSDWAETAVLWATQTGLVNGINGYLKPQDGATRAQLATMLMRGLNR